MKKGFLSKITSSDERGSYEVKFRVKDVEELARKWLLEEGYDVKKLDDPRVYLVSKALGIRIPYLTSLRQTGNLAKKTWVLCAR